MTPYLRDPDVTLWHGDALKVLRGMADESVDCVVTSPPYWGLRDYGTGQWEGGDEGCDHLGAPHRTQAGFNARYFGKEKAEGWQDKQGELREPYRATCGKCGATRIDQQIGLEPTPDQFVANLVSVFREVRRVLAPHGTCWLNLGDSYASPIGGNNIGLRTAAYGAGNERGKKVDELEATRNASSVRKNIPGLKPKDLCGIPWRVAFALQADGWYLRSDIVWAKPNPMPESVTDRPTKSHEFVFLLTKQPRYWFDQEAVRERYEDPREGGDGFRWGSERYTNQSGAQSNHTPTGRGPDGRKVTRVVGQDGSEQHRDGERWPNPTGRNVRSVWQIATQPYPEAHFATFPEELARRCVLAGCPVRVCRVCGKPSERIVEAERTNHRPTTYAVDAAGGAISGGTDRNFPDTVRRDLGWSDCGHNNWRPGLVLDPFMGSGTVAKVARDHGRHAVGIDLNADYLALAARRLQQLSLITEPA